MLIIEKDILILDNDLTQESKWLTAEAEYAITFSKQQKKFV